jgi:hypothetical protein
VIRRTLATAATAGVMLGYPATTAWSAVPGGMATGSHNFGIPGVYGISAWGHYQHVDGQVRVTVCITDTSRNVYGGAAAAVAFQGQRHQAVTVLVIGYRHVACHSMITRYTSRLTADAVSGYANGTIRQRGRVVQVY